MLKNFASPLKARVLAGRGKENGAGNKKLRAARDEDADVVDAGSDDDNDFEAAPQPARKQQPRAGPAPISKPPTAQNASDDDEEDAIEDSDIKGNINNNAFLAFARPGKKPAAVAAAPKFAAAAGRPSRAAAAAASQRTARALKDDESEEVSSEDDDDEEVVTRVQKKKTAAAARQQAKQQQATQQRRPSRAAAQKSNKRLRRDSTEEEAEEEEEAADEESEEAEAEDGASSEGDEEASGSSEDEDGEEDEVIPTRATRHLAGTAAAGAGPSTRPARACVARAAAGASRRKASIGSDDYDNEDDEAEDDTAAAATQEESRDVVVIDGSSEDGERPVQGRRAPPKRSRLRGGGAAAATAAADEPVKKEDPEAAALEDSDVEMQEAGSGDCGDNSEEDGESDEEEDEPGDSTADEDSGGCARKRAKTGGGKAKAKPTGKAAAAKATNAKQQQPAAAGRGGSERSKAREAAAAGKPREAVERILSYDSATDTYLVKLEGVSYRHLARVSTAFLEAKRGSMLRVFLSRGRLPTEVDAEWTQVDRVIAERTVSRGRGAARARQLLVKWRGLEYGEATWEEEEELLASEADKAAIERFERFKQPSRRQAAGADGPSLRKLRQKDFELPAFCSGRKLRDYQEVSVRWMVNNFVQNRNCILGDEMGLGKTAQSTSCLQTLRKVGGVHGPFLIVAPLTTLGHWQREVQTWTDMNVVLFAGSAADRAVILEHEFYHTGPSGSGSSRAALLGGGRGAKEAKFHVLLTSYETLRQEKSLFKSIPWAAAVFDEAHKLKGINSSTRATVQELDIRWLLLLTGTPIQNNMTELYSILSLLDPDGYPSLDDFNARFGGAGPGQPPSVAQIKKLQESLAPILLRRMKEDVEELPQKEEVVIWVELSQQQRAYYRALYEGCIGALLGGASAKALPQMRNLAMELRKLCCHPVLCEGLEDDLRTKLAQQRSAAEAAAAAEGHAPDTEFKCPETELLVRGSGKMTLLHKLLPKLRAEGKRVLIFSQFVVMLDVLEDYCTLMGYPVERIDGSIKGRQRQQAIDRFSAADADHDSAFVFLLSTRAGGQGITLTAADTCIIYDSDWNPQNDLQAMARCHRIGQTKEVTVYRLISNDTYEMALFSSASRKYGLDEAVLGFAAGTDPEADSARIADLLRNGAHGLLGDMEAGAKKGEAFAGEDINQILEGRTERRQIGSRAGNTFSVATFVVDDAAGTGGGGGGGDGLPPRRRGRGAAAAEDEAEKEYWRALLPDAVANHENRAPEAAVVLGPRKRTKVCYNVDAALKKRYANESDSDSDFEKEQGKDSGGSGSGSGAEGGSGSDGGAKEGAAAAAGKKRRRSAKRTGVEGGEGAGGGEGGEDGAAAEGVGPEGGKGGKGRGRRPAVNWSKAEVKALEDLVGGIGGDRWDVVYEAMQPTKRSAAEVVEAGRALWALYGRAVEIARQRMAGKLAVLAKEDEGKKEEAAAAPTEAGAAAGTDGLDEHDLLLLAELNKLPESLRGVLAVPATVLRFRKEGAFFMTHMREMMELAAWVLPEVARRQEAGQEAGQEADGASAAPGPSSAPRPGSQPLVPHIPVTDKSGLPNWWGRTEDEALLIAAAQVGYVRGRPGRTLAQALKTGHLATRLADLMPLVAPAPAAGAEEDPAVAEGKGGKAKADKGGAADGAGDDDVVMVEAEEPADKKQGKPMAVEDAGVKAEEGVSDKAAAQSQRMTQDEFKALQRAMGQRLSKVIDKAMTFRKIQAHRPKAPLPLSQIKPSGAQPQQQQQQRVMAAGAAAAAPTAAHKSLPPTPGKKPVDQSRSPSKQVMASAAAVKPAATAAPAAKPPAVAASTANATAPAPSAAAAMEAKKAASPAAAGGTAAKPAAPAPGGAAGAAPGKKKQSVLPFARLSSGGGTGGAAGGSSKLKKPEGAPAAAGTTAAAEAAGVRPLGQAAAGSATPTKNIKSAAAPVPEPGSAERPIELDDSG
ncbi:hypothetical protein HYH02_000873 [Chlamydomonas schloesseri]|uniref:Uncharacterized protein n=1 Tax=Chlamydomonas schloesseri TaxID=2026947 RepID=A0A836BDB8_9CHLO|nr:hypothetical protein HYH02_000873 [Chlamydomonas schloesseri]|eukprot:KAG2455048.1 hypothetical protein HYH02_000873 [Chlamydomonas schloesseri]